MLDPCYGVFHHKTARILNRVILISEITAISAAAYAFVRLDDVYMWEWYHWAMLIAGAMLVIPVVNLVIRKLWDILMVLIYGTTDADEIVDARNERVERRRNRKPRWTLKGTQGGANELTPAQRLQLQKDILRGGR